MEKSKKGQAEKLQIKYDKLVQTKEKKQQAFDKAKTELTAVTKSVDTAKLKLFEILQSGSDDMAFSNWAKRKISENGNDENVKSAKSENDISVNHANANSENHQKPIAQNHQPQTAQNQNQRQ